MSKLNMNALEEEKQDKKPTGFALNLNKPQENKAKIVPGLKMGNIAAIN